MKRKLTHRKPSHGSHAAVERTPAASEQELATPSTPSAPAAETSSGPAFASEPMLFEISWEVCQQVGGIYTVIRSKVPGMIERWGRRYCLIGPYNPESAASEFEEGHPTGRIAEALRALADQGIRAHYGTWLITGRPQVILIEPWSLFDRLGRVKYFLWDHHGIPTPAEDPLLNGVLAFGHGVEQFFRCLTAQNTLRRPVIAHFHEWMAGSCIPELRRDHIDVAIVFTTHATMLGRYLAMNDPWFYDHVPFVDWQKEARHFNIEAQVRIERAAAHGAHVFTTLSDITAYECQHLLGRGPDLLLPNGLNIERFTAMHEFQNLHREYKERIHRFVMAHFFPSYTFDLDRTMYFFTSGRYEYRNKGFDLTIEALARLNHRLKHARSDRTIVFFLVSKRPFRSVNPDVLSSQAILEEIRQTCNSIKEQVAENLFHSTALGQTPRFDDLVDDYWRLRLRRTMQAWKRRRLPAIVTHDLVDDTHDEVLQQLRSYGLINSPHDPVKFVYHPDFITVTSPLFGMDYDQFVRGCHLGVFPSYYEPWGYTPPECVARGVPAVTSDLAGFGTYLMQHMADYQQHGMYVVHRRYKSWDESANELTNWLYDFTQLERRDRISLRNNVESTSERFDWSNLLRHYDHAYDMVRQRTGK